MIGSLSIAALGGCFAQDATGAVAGAYFPSTSTRIPSDSSRVIVYPVNGSPFPNAASMYFPFTEADIPSIRSVFRSSFPANTGDTYAYVDALYYKNASNSIICGARTQYGNIMVPECTTEASQPFHRYPNYNYKPNELITTSIEGATYRVQDNTYEMYVVPGITTRLKVLVQYGRAVDYRGAWYQDNYFKDFCMPMSDTAGKSAIYGYLGECLIEF